MVARAPVASWCHWVPTTLSSVSGGSQAGTSKMARSVVVPTMGFCPPLAASPSVDQRGMYVLEHYRTTRRPQNRALRPRPNSSHSTTIDNSMPSGPTLQVTRTSPQAARAGSTREEARIMITRRVPKTGNSYVVTIPREEMERPNIADGDLVSLGIRTATVSDELPPELEAAFNRSWEAHRETYRFLAE